MFVSAVFLVGKQPLGRCRFPRLSSLHESADVRLLYAVSHISSCLLILTVLGRQSLHAD